MWRMAKEHPARAHWEVEVIEVVLKGAESLE